MNSPLKPEESRLDRSNWREHASCREYGVTAEDDPWFSDSPSERAFAVAICRRCPTIAQCRVASKGQDYGVWAGEPRGWVSPTPDMPATVAVARCGACGRRTRPVGITAAEAPNTALEGRRGFCRTCTRKGYAP